MQLTIFSLSMSWHVADISTEPYVFFQSVFGMRNCHTSLNNTLPHPMANRITPYRLLEPAAWPIWLPDTPVPAWHSFWKQFFAIAVIFDFTANLYNTPFFPTILPAFYPIISIAHFTSFSFHAFRSWRLSGTTFVAQLPLWRTTVSFRAQIVSVSWMVAGATSALIPFTKAPKFLQTSSLKFSEQFTLVFPQPLS